MNFQKTFKWEGGRGHLLIKNLYGKFSFTLRLYLTVKEGGRSKTVVQKVSQNVDFDFDNGF